MHPLPHASATPLHSIREYARVPNREIPFETEVRVMGGRLEIWRFSSTYGEKQTSQFCLIDSAKLRRRRFPRPRQIFYHKPAFYDLYVYKCAKKAWKRDGKLPRWAIRFNSFAMIECGVLEAAS